MPLPELKGMEIESLKDCGAWNTSVSRTLSPIGIGLTITCASSGLIQATEKTALLPSVGCALLRIHTQFALNDAEERLRNAVRRWVELAVDETGAEFDYDH
jgi:hypothetical protein